MDSTLAGLLVSSIWLGRAQYEVAESRNEEYIARDHTGLKVEVNSRIIFILEIILLNYGSGRGRE